MSDRPPVDVALVVPVYNERDSLPLLIDEIARAVGGGAAGRSYEIVAVDDGSTDGSLELLRGLRRDHPELHVVALAEHAGQTAALAAGFRAARGRVVVTLDADLQNDPADVPALLAELERSRAAAVVGYRVNRHDSAWKRLQSRIANGVRNRLNRETIRDTGCSLKAFRADAGRSRPGRAARARHLAGCRHCAESRVSHIEMRVAFARSAGQPHAHTVPRPAIRGRTLAVWMLLSLIAGAAAGWSAHVQWGGPGPTSREATRALFVAQ